MAMITITKEEYENLINQVKMIPQVAQQTIKLMEENEKLKKKDMYKAIAEEKIKENEKLKKDLEHAKQAIISLTKVAEKGEEKLKKEREEAKVLEDWKSTMESNGYGICEECGVIVNGECEGWHDHSKHGYLSVCDGCGDTK